MIQFIMADAVNEITYSICNGRPQKLKNNREISILFKEHFFAYQATSVQKTETISIKLSIFLMNLISVRLCWY